MERYTICDKATAYTRITKSDARKMFNKGESFYIIAHKMRPGFPFSLGMLIDGAHYAKENAERAPYGLSQETFDTVVQEFCWYNANCHETGTYAAFYRMSDRKQRTATAEGK
jgi:hypothetical protein